MTSGNSITQIMRQIMWHANIESMPQASASTKLLLYDMFNTFALMKSWILGAAVSGCLDYVAVLLRSSTNEKTKIYIIKFSELKFFFASCLFCCSYTFSPSAKDKKQTNLMKLFFAVPHFKLSLHNYY